MAARDRDRARRAPATGLTGLLADEAKDLLDLARRLVPTRRRAGILGLALLALLALSGVAGAAEPDPANRSALEAWGASPAPVASAPAAASSAPVASAGPVATADPLPGGAIGTSTMFAGPDMLDLGLKALLVIVLLFVTLRVLKRVQGGGSLKKAGQLLDVVESRTIGPKTQLHLIAVGDRRLVVGQSPSGLVALGELDAAELPLTDAAAILEALGIVADEPTSAPTRPDPAPARRLPAATGRDLFGARPATERRAAADGRASTDTAGRASLDRAASSDTAGRAARTGDPSPVRPAAPRPAAVRPVTDRPAPDRLDRSDRLDRPAPDRLDRSDRLDRPVTTERIARPMDVRVAAYARPIAELDATGALDELPPVRPIRSARPVAEPAPSIVAAAPRHTAPSVEERIERARTRARAERAAEAARAERHARVDRALAAADRAAIVAERAAEAAERALAAADRAAEPSIETIARARMAAAQRAAATAPARQVPRAAAQPRAAIAPAAAPAAEAPAATESLVAMALRMAQAGRGREAGTGRPAASPSAPAPVAPAPAAAPSETDIAAILAALAAQPAEALPVERPRAQRRLEVSA